MNALPKPSRFRRFAVRTIRVAAAVYVLLCLIAFFVQPYMAFPAAAFQGKPETTINFGRRAEVLHLATADGTPVAAVFGAALSPDGSPGPTDAPTILYFYGNGGSVAWSQGEFDHFRRLGCNVLIPDYLGYGQSGGTATEPHFYATADTAYDYLLHRPGVDPHRIIVAGWSLGGAVAIELAARRPVAGLAVFNAFTTMPAVAHGLLPWLPTSILLRYRFDNLNKVESVHCPVLICNGGMDTLVPAWMSDDLAKTAPGPVTRLTIPTADHNSIFTADPPAVYAAVDRLVKQANGLSGVPTSVMHGTTQTVTHPVHP